MSQEILNLLIENLNLARNNNSKSQTIDALFKLAQYNYQNEEYHKSKLLFQEILSLNKKTKYVNFYIALCKINLEKYDSALKYLKEELKIFPENKKAKLLKEKLEINSNIPLITILLIILNSIVFIFTYPLIQLIDLIKFAAYDTSLTPINLFTSIFFHINTIHFSINMIFLLLFGLILEKNIGSFKFLGIYITSGIIGNLAQAYLSPQTFVLGASSAIFGILAALALRLPLLKVKFLGLINMPIIIAFGGFFAISNLIMNFIKLNQFSNGDIAHLFGFMAGILITGLIYRETIEIFYNWLFIFFGFWIISLSLQSIITNILTNTNLNLDIVFQFILILLGLLLITYSYYKLKELKRLKIETGEES